MLLLKPHKSRFSKDGNLRPLLDVKNVLLNFSQVPLTQNAEPGWLAGMINGHTGWFPETYVEKMLSPTDDAQAIPYEEETYNDNNAALEYEIVD